MTHDRIFRVPTAARRDAPSYHAPLLPPVGDLGPKPLSDGLSADLAGGVWITGTEHGAVLRRAPDGRVETWLPTPRIRWADALSWGPDGWLYLADSALPEQMLRSRAHIAAEAPYFVYRFHPTGVTGVPGQKDRSGSRPDLALSPPPLREPPEDGIMRRRGRRSHTVPRRPQVDHLRSIEPG